jgi:hypothetical protein
MKLCHCNGDGTFTTVNYFPGKQYEKHDNCHIVLN